MSECFNASNYESLFDKTREIENAICELYKEANSVLSLGLEDEKDIKAVRHIKKLCVRWLSEIVF